MAARQLTNDVWNSSDTEKPVLDASHRILVGWPAYEVGERCHQDSRHAMCHPAHGGCRQAVTIPDQDIETACGIEP